MKVTNLSPKAQNILVVIIFAMLITTSILGYGIYSIYSVFSEFAAAREIPPEIKQPRILTGKDFLKKQAIFHITPEGFLEILSESLQTPDARQREKIVKTKLSRSIYNFEDLKVNGDEIIAVGQFGGYVFGLSGNLKREIIFESDRQKTKIGWFETETNETRLDNLQIVQLAKNKYGFLSFDLTGGVLVFDDTGKIIWRF